MELADLVIIGGGQSGLAAAYAAREAGLAPVVLEAGQEPVGSWPHYYDSLTLFSPARFSELPGKPFPGDPERYPTRDEVVSYLRDYAVELGTDIRCDQRVESVIVLEGGAFEVRTAAGLTLQAEKVIAATGGFGTPNRPSLPGLGEFAGQVLHASEYRSPDSFAEQRVLVVGGGNSAVQIAAELAEVAHTTITTRSPLKWKAQRPLGRDIHWWLTRTGLDSASLGSRLWGNTTPVIDDGRYRAALAAGAPDHRPIFRRLTPRGVIWDDGREEAVDAVILATGYRPHLPYLAGTGALDERGEPIHRHGVSTTVRGFGYVGLERQRSIASATVRGVGADARRVLERLQAESRPARNQARWRPAVGRLCCRAVAR